MARARLIKPEFFANETLADVPAFGRLLFIGLWTLVDREGRIADRPKWIKGALFPYESVNVDRLLNDLYRLGFIVRYEVEGQYYIQVVNFKKHQHPHQNEVQSVIPPDPTLGESTSDIGESASPNEPSARAVSIAVPIAVIDPVAVGGAPADPTSEHREIKKAWENRIGPLPMALVEEFDRYIKFTPHDYFLGAIEVTRTEAERPSWAFCKKVIDGAVARGQPPGFKVGPAPVTSVAQVLEQRRARR